MTERRSLQTAAAGRELVVTIPYNSLSVDLGGFTERISPRAFSRTLQAGQEVLALWSHDPSKPLARRSNGTLELSSSDTELTARITLDGTSWSGDAGASIAAGTVVGASFAFDVREDAWRRESGLWTRTLLDVDLIEISPTAAAAYPAATAAAA